MPRKQGNWIIDLKICGRRVDDNLLFPAAHFRWLASVALNPDAQCGSSKPERAHAFVVSSSGNFLTWPRPPRWQCAGLESTLRAP
jgi:hypothetical protein